jgi:L-methionine (R)-S-oxide reductase
MKNTNQIDTLNLSKVEKYDLLFTYWQGLADSEVDWISNTSNAAALLKEIFGWWWVGFYRVYNNQLILGPFQGPSACTKIEYGKGVCGKTWEIKQSIVVPNVHEFEGHIACSSLSNSEIVIPIWKNDAIWGVLDIDSVEYSKFNEIDQLNLENFTNILSKYL